MAETTIQLVLFDLGGVLVELAGSWSRACELAGIDVPDALNQPKVIEQFKPWLDANERGDMSNDAFDEQVAKLIGLSAQQVRRISTAWLVGPYPRVSLLIDQLTAAGVQTGCLSNTNAHHWSLMNGRDNPASLPLGPMQYRFASQEIRASKPDPAIYEHVERETGLEPQQLLFFDDLEPNITAARQRGWAGEIIELDGDPVTQMFAHLDRLNVYTELKGNP